MNPFLPTPPRGADKSMSAVAAFVVSTTLVAIVVGAALLIGVV